MSETVVIDPETLSKLDDQLWRRLGITQTFDRLLVEATASNPGAPAEVQSVAGRALQGGAAKFWEMSFPQIKKDLCRRGVLAESTGNLTLADDFADKLSRLIHDVDEGVSRVEPTPGVTLDDVMKKAAEREEKEKARKSAARKPRARKTSSTSTTPRKRSGAKSDDAADAADAAESAEADAAKAAASSRPAPAARVAPPNKLFTTIKVNKLLDHLDNTTLARTQLGQRLELSGANLERFLEVTGALDITRIERDDLVQLHWRGRELAQTSSADRRMTVHDLVRELRKHALGEGDEG